MRIRIKFRKYGVMRFIGHLDIMRYFQKAMRRANIDIAYSEGFSPHQIMSFAAPLGVGITSDGEYLDIEAKSTKSTQESIAALNAVMVDGIEITQYVALRQDEKKAMTAVGAADYIVYFKNEIDFTQEELEEKIRETEQKKTTLTERLENLRKETAAMEQRIEDGKAEILRLLNARASMKAEQQRLKTMQEQASIHRAQLNKELLEQKSGPQP